MCALRFNQGLIELLANMEMLGEPVHSSGEEAQDMFMPALKAHELNGSDEILDPAIAWRQANRLAHDHHHSHAHHHFHNRAADTTGRALWWSIALTVGFVVVETAFGFQAGSLALLSDAAHNVTDALALGLAAFGFYIQTKPADEQKTYGYHRAGVLAAFVNALSLLLISAVIFWESFHRLTDPHPVQENTMIVVAALGLVVNGAVMWNLNHQKDHDLNIRAAWVHMLGDALGSIAIIIGAIGIRYTGWEQIDPILSILIGGLIIWTAWDIVKESLNILLEALPKGMDLEEIRNAMRTVEGVVDVHDLHIWSLGSSNHALSCHVLIQDQPHSSSEAILQRVNTVLHRRYDIHHTTVQFEHTPCAIGENGCTIQGSDCCD